MNALTIIMIVSALLLAGWFLIMLATIMLDGEDEDGWNDRR